MVTALVVCVAWVVLSLPLTILLGRFLSVTDRALPDRAAKFTVERAARPRKGKVSKPRTALSA